jgi:hypothetical protein
MLAQLLESVRAPMGHRTFRVFIVEQCVAMRAA